MNQATPNILEIPEEDVIASIKEDLIHLCEDEILAVLGSENEDLNYSVTVNLMELNGLNPTIVNKFLQKPTHYVTLLQKALYKAQEDLISKPDLSRHLSIKPKIHLRISFEGASFIPELCKTKIPRSAEVDRFISIKGTIIRTGRPKMLETQAMFKCSKCKGEFVMRYEIDQYNKIPKPYKCLATAECDGSKFQEISSSENKIPDFCIDYQEVKIQEQANKLSIGTIPKSMIVILTHDLVDTCKAGDDVTISGMVIRRWKNLNIEDRCDVEISLLASHIRVHNEQRGNALLTDETIYEFEQFWAKYANDKLRARDIILSSVCSKLYGLYLVKLALMLVLVGGVSRYDKNGAKVRGDAHLLLVGDPGTGKSQFLNFATKVSNRSVLTTGIGSTNAGLTAAAIKDSGEWQLEAGALVLADRGICCIDEFGSIREQDKTAIHEAMEQQTISVAKAGLVCKLNTRCSIIAATNSKGKYDVEQSVAVNIALGSPLLSRFDIILVLLDTQNDEWDKIVSSYILINETEQSVDLGTQKDNQNDNSNHLSGNNSSSKQWSFDKLQTYIIYVKSTFRPMLTEESSLVLQKYYQFQRGADLRNAARTTVRLLESLIRIAQAHAKLMCQDEVTICDAVAAVMLMEASLNTSALAEIQSTMHKSFSDDPSEEHIRQESMILRRLGLEHLSVHCKHRSSLNGNDDENPNAFDNPNSNLQHGSDNNKNRPDFHNREENNDDEESEEEDENLLSAHERELRKMNERPNQRKRPTTSSSSPSHSSYELQGFELFASDELNLGDLSSISSQQTSRNVSSNTIIEHIKENQKTNGIIDGYVASVTKMKPNESKVSQMKPIKHLEVFDDLDLGDDDAAADEFLRQTMQNENQIIFQSNENGLSNRNPTPIAPTTQAPEIGITPTIQMPLSQQQTTQTQSNLNLSFGSQNTNAFGIPGSFRPSQDPTFGLSRSLGPSIQPLREPNGAFWNSQSRSSVNDGVLLPNPYLQPINHQSVIMNQTDSQASNAKNNQVPAPIIRKKKFRI